MHWASLLAARQHAASFGSRRPLHSGCDSPPGGTEFMPSYKAPVDDAQFLLNDVFRIDRYANLPGFADASPGVVSAILEEAAKYSEAVLTPLNRTGDIEGCVRRADGS